MVGESTIVENNVCVEKSATTTYFLSVSSYYLFGHVTLRRSRVLNFDLLFSVFQGSRIEESSLLVELSLQKGTTGVMETVVNRHQESCEWIPLHLIHHFQDFSNWVLFRWIVHR